MLCSRVDVKYRWPVCRTMCIIWRSRSYTDDIYIMLCELYEGQGRIFIICISRCVYHIRVKVIYWWSVFPAMRIKWGSRSYTDYIYVMLCVSHEGHKVTHWLLFVSCEGQGTIYVSFWKDNLSNIECCFC